MRTLPFSTLLAAVLLLLTACESESYLTEPELTTPETTATLDFRKAFPDLISLPDGFAPEGIVAGDGNDFYVGSLASGAIYRGDFRNGTGEVIYTPEVTGPAVGLDFDKNTKYLYIAGGPTGTISILDTRTGELVAQYSVPGAGFINDVVVRKDAAYFTDSFTPNFYRIPLSASGQPSGAVETVPLGPGFDFVTGGFNSNGIVYPPFLDTIIIINSSTGTLYTVDPELGTANAIDLGGASLLAGDGMVLQGKTLYVVQNQFNQIAVVQLSNDLQSGTVTEYLTDADFDIPTTATLKGGRLYAVNARFGTPVTPTTSYDVVLVGE